MESTPQGGPLTKAASMTSGCFPSLLSSLPPPRVLEGEACEMTERYAHGRNRTPSSPLLPPPLPRKSMAPSISIARTGHRLDLAANTNIHLPPLPLPPSRIGSLKSSCWPPIEPSRHILPERIERLHLSPPLPPSPSGRALGYSSAVDDLQARVLLPFSSSLLAPNPNGQGPAKRGMKVAAPGRRAFLPSPSPFFSP